MTKLYRTFKDSVTQYVSDNNIHKKEIRDALKEYAHFLDGFQVVTKDFEIAALKKSRDIDRETISLLIDEVGVYRAREIILKVTNRHRHYSQWQDRQKAKGGRNWPTALNWLNERQRLWAWLTWNIGKYWPRARAWGLTEPTTTLSQEQEQQINDTRKATEKTE